MVQQKVLLVSEPLSLKNEEVIEKFRSLADLDKRKKMFNNVFKSERKIVTSKSFNCLSDTENLISTDNTNDAIKTNLISGLYNRRSKSYNEIYFLKKSINRNNMENQLLSKKKAISTSKIEKCVRFNDDIKVQELNDEYDRRPMPLAKMYYKDQVELSQLREEMKQIQYRIINKIEGKVLLGN